MENRNNNFINRNPAPGGSRDQTVNNMGFNIPPPNRTSTGSSTVNRPSLDNMPGPSGMLNYIFFLGLFAKA